MFGKRKDSKNKAMRDNEELTPWERQQLLREENIEKKQKKSKKILISSNLVKFNGLRKKRLQKRVITLASIFGISAVISLYAILPVSRVSNIEIEGTDSQTKTAIIEASQVKKNESLFAVVPTKFLIRQRIKNDVATVKDVNISLKKNVVKFKVTEYDIVGYIQRKNTYYKLTSNGRELNVGQKATNGNYPLFLDFKKKTLLHEAAQQVGEMPKKVRFGISEIHSSPTKVNPKRVRLVMNDGNEVIGSIDTLATKMSYYPSMAKALGKKGVIDLEVGAYAYPYDNK
ncbi:cell division protein FtsQ/DivIB [Ligilactobacillus salivarius]|uniref:cell division protein FtsQ/DivIB n=1 Tax=Ligilactobacillus salivarius TaxID=1624 RepID=UPI00066980C6|nr:cell division protein FtsQ/DivIB [Ligilactobacillus salivarius]MDE1506038.1 cell division protein FtsQ/DivIB [Ligilactobacillus salivarius]MDE1520819.1 cell division protein FtsQ/DivIB [Ligilactobacillus salivarius]MDH4959405.1 cell division protein FtsQ/DivIB [Ligilactobacillus salivarius]UUY22723.1 cell division protein FtsQ/DivIB [Ligilactobacillus salivarius]